jgi:hypothetical protein
VKKKNLKLLRNDCWGKKATQVVGGSLFISEGKSFVVVWISQQRIPTVEKKKQRKIKSEKGNNMSFSLGYGNPSGIGYSTSTREMHTSKTITMFNPLLRK